MAIGMLVSPKFINGLYCYRYNDNMNRAGHFVKLMTLCKSAFFPVFALFYRQTDIFRIIANKFPIFGKLIHQIDACFLDMQVTELLEYFIAK